MFDVILDGFKTDRQRVSHNRMFECHVIYDGSKTKTRQCINVMHQRVFVIALRISSEFLNFVYCLSKNRFTVSTGPLRCLDQVAEFCIFFNEKKIYCINRTITMFGDYKFSVLIIAIWIIIIFTI